MPAYEINCDMGESYGLYKMGDDEGLMPHVHLANIACGFHASDPVTMARTVRLAKENGVKVGAHPSLPDREGFGRREMRLTREELRAAFVYQIGALAGFLRAEGMTLNHVKPHGIVYGMAARQEEVALAICEAVSVFGVPMFGMAGTCHETAARRIGVPFVGEFFGDLEYDETGRLIITREHPPVDLDWAMGRLDRAMSKGQVQTTGGTDMPVSFKTICIHSDTPNAVTLATALRSFLDARR
jgi:UPF0271 protein